MERLSARVSGLLCALAAIFILLIVEPVSAQGPQPIESQQLAGISVQLENQLAAASDPVSFLVILDAQVDAEGFMSEAVVSAEAGEPARIQRAELLYRTLTEDALSAQAPVRAWLDERGVPYRAFYIVNMIEVQGDAELARNLRTLPGIDRLAANPLVRGQGPVATDPANTWLSLLPVEGLQSAVTWAPGLYGLPYTHAPEVWDVGYTGVGIVVASQDTGVQWDHPALINNYRGYYPSTAGVIHRFNWFDAWATPSPDDLCGPDHQIPCDDNGHGTHTVGTMLGDATSDTSNSLANLGMAPGAKWIGCRNMRNNFGTPATYAACFEFMLAPYPQNGDPFTDGRPALAPHIVNNSWSCPPAEGCDADSLRQVVETARVAGQLVVASAGNYGPYCATVRYPIGLHDAVFTIGAHDQYGAIASFSSRGPVSADGSNRLKPDLVAPGVAVLSTIPYNNYGHKSGTSMSSPHVAGAAALLWSAAPNFIGDIDLTEQVLIKSATPVDNDTCLSGPASSPNPTYGYGRLDALAAVTLARTPWEVIVTVVDEAGNPQSGLRIEMVDKLTYFPYVADTNPEGIANLQPVLSGSYTLRAGSGDARVAVPVITLPATDDPDIGVRRRQIEVTVPLPTALDDDEAPPPPMLYLPRVGQ